MQVLLMTPADGSNDPLILIFSPGGNVLRDSTLAALQNVQSAIDGIPPNGGGAGDGGTGVTSDDLDNLDAALNGQADAIRAKTGQAAPAADQPNG